MKKYRKIIIILVVVLAIFAVLYIALRPTEEVKEDQTKGVVINTEMRIEADLLLEGANDNDDLIIVHDRFYNDLYPEVDLGGQDEFLIMPIYENTGINIYKQTMNENGEMELELIKSTPSSVYIKCNESDLYSNVVIKVEYNNYEFSYSPFYDLKDGDISKHNNVHYMTVK